MHDLVRTKMEGVIEYNECNDVVLIEDSEVVTIMAINEGGYNSTQVDLRSLLLWLKFYRPDLLNVVF